MNDETRQSQYDDTLIVPAPRPRLRDGAFWFVLLSLAITSLLHYLTDAHLIPYHSVYRSFYYAPIAVAAVRYGLWGGLITAAVASLLYLPHVALTWHAVPGGDIGNLLENVVFLAVGGLVGWLADAERRQRRQAQQAAAQLVAANREIQQQMHLAEQARAALASILESIESGVITLDSAGRVTSRNRAAHTLLAGLDGDRLPTMVRTYLDNDARGFRQFTLGGRTLGMHGAPLIGAEGRRVGTVLVLDDLSDLRSLEEQVQRAQRLAALGRLAGGLAHEIRNPLGIVRAAAQLLGHRVGDDAELADYSGVIQRESDRMDQLIERLLAYARPVHVQRSTLQVEELLARTAALTDVYARQQHVRLTYRASGELPPIVGDAELLYQALVNLVLNAVQATSAGGEVALSAAASDGSVTITVADTGQGIAEENLSRVFDPFFTTRDDGTGLGLSIVQQIVQGHDGTIQLMSEPGHGTQVALALPRADRDSPEHLAHPAEAMTLPDAEVRP